METSTLQAVVLISAERADVARGGALCKKTALFDWTRTPPPSSQQPWLTLRERKGLFFFLIFHFEGAFIVLTATQGRKSDVVPCPPRPPRPHLGLLGTRQTPLLQVPSPLGSPSVFAGIATSGASPLLATEILRAEGGGDGGIGKKSRQKIKVLLCLYFPKHSRLLIPLLFSAGALPSSRWFLSGTLARGPGAGLASSQGSRAGRAATWGRGGGG